jgi:preprotein translocase subunit YajC
MAMGQYGSILIYLVFFVGLMYFMIFLPQKKRDKKAKEMLTALQVGNNVTTIGGIMGKIINIKDDEVVIETSIEKTQVVVKKWAVKDVEKPIEA